MALQLLTMLGIVVIVFQDLKERMVHWVLFPLVGVFLGALYLRQTSFINYVVNVGSNIILVGALIFLLWVYTKILRRQDFLNASLGLGDILFLCAFALGFPTVSFIVLLAFSLCFSVLAFVVLNYFVNAKTVPLAGFIGLFLLGILLLSNIPGFVSLYHI